MSNDKYRNLHSSMDRFEVLNYAKIEQEQKKIYIPVWIDLKAVSEIVTSSLKRFTFQYG